MAQTVARSRHIVEIIRQEPTDLGFCEASGIRVGGVWLNPSGLGISIAWRHPWQFDIIKALILDRNLEATLTNSDLELSALVLHEATLLDTCPEAIVAAPRSGSDNTPTVFWTIREALTINPVVADLLRIHTLHSCHFFSTLWSSTTQAWKIAWRMTHLAYLI